MEPGRGGEVGRRGEALFLSKTGTIANYATGYSRCYSRGARAQCFNGRVETRSPVPRTVVELLDGFVDARLFS
eukprot:2337595-Pyramimonas_sp.AAC.1